MISTSSLPSFLALNSFIKNFGRMCVTPDHPFFSTQPFAQSYGLTSTTDTESVADVASPIASESMSPVISSSTDYVKLSASKKKMK